MKRDWVAYGAHKGPLLILKMTASEAWAEAQRYHGSNVEFAVLPVLTKEEAREKSYGQD